MSVSERQLEPPENYYNTPCDDCSIFGGRIEAPEEMLDICNEDEQDIDKCPLWNPEPLTCVACGKVLPWPQKDDMCKECQREEARLQYEDEWNPDYLVRYPGDQDDDMD